MAAVTGCYEGIEPGSAVAESASTGLFWATTGAVAAEDPTGSMLGESAPSTLSAADGPMGGNDTTGSEAPFGTTGSEAVLGSTGAPAPSSVAQGIAIERVEANQGVAVALVAEGTPIELEERNAELIHGRRTLIRAFWTVDETWEPREIEARLEIDTPTGPVELVDRRRIEGPPDPYALEGSFMWLLEADAVAPDATYAVSLWESEPAYLEQPEVDVRPGVRLPAEGTLALGIRPEPMRLRLVVIPLQNPDGGVEPSDAARRSLEERFLAGYPVQEVEVVWREPAVVSGRLTQDQQGWDILSAAREEDDAPPNVYYHLLLDNDTCCIESNGQLSWGGIGGVSDDRPSSANWGGRDAMSKVEVQGDGSLTTSTMVHEVGHNHGRPHAPCGGVAGADENWPIDGAYQEAGVGVQGFDILDEVFYDPFPPMTSNRDRPYKDIMSYCWPSWWSDYNWQLNLERVRLLTSWESAQLPERVELASLVAYVDASGVVRWSHGQVDGRFIDDEAGITAELTTADGRTVRAVAHVVELPENDGRRVTVVVPPGFQVREARVPLGDRTLVYGK